MNRFIILVLLLFVLGCSPNGFVEDLYTRGAKPSSTDKLVFTGSEADFGPDIRVAITDRKVINTVWDSILNSKNYGRYSACGNRTIEFYSVYDCLNPLVTLKVMCGGLKHGSPVYIDGKATFPWDASKDGRDGLYQCRGLDGLVLKYLKEEYEERSRYLREMPSIVTDFEVNHTESKLEFECVYYKPHKIQKGERTYLGLREKVNIPTEKMPNPTVDFTRHLIQEQFLSKPETWPDGFFGDTKYIKAVLKFVPIENYYQKKFPEIWDYRLYIDSYHPQHGIGKTVWEKRFLISPNGYVLYGEENKPWEFSYVKRGGNGIFIDIIHSFSSPRVISDKVTGIVTEYFYEFGGKGLIKLKESDERVEVLTYLNDYFDGKFCNGKK